MVKKEREDRERKYMKVLLIDQIAKVNYKYTFPLANGLVKHGVDVQLVIDQKKEPENCLCRRKRLFNTDEKNVGKFAKMKNYISSYRSIYRMLDSQEYDILHTEWYTFSPIDYLFLKKIKNKFRVRYVATVHDILPFNQKAYDMFFHRRLYKLADSIILQAPGNMERFATLFPESKHKTKMIPHGHMLDYVEPRNKKESRKKLGLPMNKTIIMFFGQIKKVKGVDIFLKSLAQLKNRYPNLYAVVAGSVWKADFAECEEIIEQYGLADCLKTDIRYIPNEDVKYYYSASDICILPYTDVYQSGVIQLAYGYRKPVVATSLDAFTQFVKEGETGFLAAPGDEKSLTAAIERAMAAKDNLENIGNAGYELVHRKLNWDNLTEQIVHECYEESGEDNKYDT